MLYSYLSHHSFLDAAYLWLVARVAKEGLVNMPNDISGVSFLLACDEQHADMKALLEPSGETMGDHGTIQIADRRPCCGFTEVA